MGLGRAVLWDSMELASLSIRQDRSGRAATAAAASGNRRVKSLPLRVMSRTPAASRLDPKTVVLDLVNPVRARRRHLSRGRQARFYEADKPVPTLTQNYGG